ncbi:uncharacterized protein, LmbE homolog [Longilinea arvoryzae]|uniref:Uncharacterized protein, LmbE homolog n=1 Tax=Longilinea arvoryzae TaxID=360412 RepID=A0A0S7B8B4_9CHLR|nr:PIG-L family deacetylase [Longilinea arvoryzae]GAP13470.1 uncharacterized protein, LmbE homolog [Longilinea arvoryzae]
MNLEHIYLSPHLDDAVYSCGGRIFNQRQSGQAVRVITICAGQADAVWFSPFAQEYHHLWGDPPDPVGLRLEEDRRALAVWNVAGIYWPTPDSIYRFLNDLPVYPNQTALFSPPHQQEAHGLLMEWMQRWEALDLNLHDVRLYAPLAAGRHVDHVLVNRFARLLENLGWSVWYYEDFPHAYDRATLDAALATFGPATRTAHTERIDLQAKLTAMLVYSSQVSMMFGDADGLKARVRDFTADRAVAIDFGERMRWLLAGAGGRRERLWRSIFGYHAFAERYWSIE